MITDQEKLRMWLVDTVVELAEQLEGDEPYATYTIRNVTDHKDIECHTARIRITDGTKDHYFSIGVHASTKD